MVFPNNYKNKTRITPDTEPHGCSASYYSSMTEPKTAATKPRGAMRQCHQHQEQWANLKVSHCPIL
jgi:hypothetical protein